MSNAKIVAGLGFRAGCPAEELAALVRQAALAQGVVVTRLAVPDFKSDAAELTRAAGLLGFDVQSITGEALASAQADCLTRSAAALAAVGVASVAEACALAGAGVGARLLAPRLTSPSATCALARGDPS